MIYFITVDKHIVGQRSYLTEISEDKLKQEAVKYAQERDINPKGVQLVPANSKPKMKQYFENLEYKEALNTGANELEAYAGKMFYFFKAGTLTANEKNNVLDKLNQAIMTLNALHKEIDNDGEKT